jgi:ribosomal protein S18 acetylase RimI-like enzyme
LSRKPPFKVRRGRPSDAEPLALVYQAAYSAPPSLEKWALGPARRRLSQLARHPDVRSWTVTVLGHPVGFAFLQVREGFDGPYGELLEAAIHPYFQRQGMGNALARTLRAFKKEKGLRVVYTLAYRGNHGKFYRKAGFRPSRNSLVYVWR